MNLLLLGILALTCLFILRGYRRGLFKSAVSTIGVVLAVFITALVYPYVATLISSQTNLDEEIQKKIDTRINDVIENETTRAGQIESLENMDGAEYIKEILIEHNNSDSYTELAVDNFRDYVSAYLTNMIIRGIAYIITYIVIMLIVFILIHCAHIFTSIPIINSIDKIGGVIFGVIEVLFIVWIFFVLITMLSAFEGGATMMKMIDENPLLSFIYKKDIFLKFVIDIVEIV